MQCIGQLSTTDSLIIRKEAKISSFMQCNGQLTTRKAKTFFRDKLYSWRRRRSLHMYKRRSYPFIIVRGVDILYLLCKVLKGVDILLFCRRRRHPRLTVLDIKGVDILLFS